MLPIRSSSYDSLRRHGSIACRRLLGGIGHLREADHGSRSRLLCVPGILEGLCHICGLFHTGNGYGPKSDHGTAVGLAQPAGNGDLPGRLSKRNPFPGRNLWSSRGGNRSDHFAGNRGEEYAGQDGFTTMIRQPRSLPFQGVNRRPFT